VTHRSYLLLAALLVVSIAAASCGGGGPSPGQTPSPTPATREPAGSTAPPIGELPDVRLVKIASLEQPIAMAVRPGDPALYVAEKTGMVAAIRGGRVDPAPVLDLSRHVSQGGEQGLLGLAFSPDGRFLYASFTDTAGNSHVTEFTMDGDRADASSARTVLYVRQPYANHNGGGIAFGPDGDLYVGLGDGGSEGDPHGNGQSLATLLGKLLRIRPTPDGAAPYEVPAGNPFVGTPGVRPEIWAFGLRNPWRFSFDRQTGDLWIGDVGQGEWEEVDRQSAGSNGGQNYGWNLTEGNHSFDGASPPANWVRPVYEYSHDTGGCAIVGGYVYRGAAIPALAGAYLFSDNCNGRIMGLRTRGGAGSIRSLGALVPSPSSFGLDLLGELYVLSLEGGVYRIVPG
jgi:glucose/arabinose dehydrogenase